MLTCDTLLLFMLQVLQQGNYQQGAAGHLLCIS
jgi:hypothetical protein